jgi:integrase
MPAPLERTSVPGIFKRGDAYVVVYRFNGRQHKRTCRSFADARSAKAQLKADIDRGEYERGRGTFEDYARTWVDSYTGRTTRGFRESTRRGYGRAIEQRAIPYFSKRSKVMTDIGAPEIRGFIAWLFDDRAQGRVLSLGTVRADVASVRALFATAVEDGVLRHNPALGVRISHPRPPVAADAREQRRALDQEDLARFLAACPEDWRLFFELLAHTGMRIGEAIELRWKDIDLGRKRVCVRRQIYRGRVSDPKSRFGRRDIPSRRRWRGACGPSKAPLRGLCSLTRSVGSSRTTGCATTS